MTPRAKGRKERRKAEGDGGWGLGVASAVDSVELFCCWVLWQSPPEARWRSRSLPSNPHLRLRKRTPRPSHRSRNNLPRMRRRTKLRIRLKPPRKRRKQ